MNPCTSNDNSPEGGFPSPEGCGGASPAGTARTFGGGAGGAAAARPRERERRPRRGSARVTQRVTERARSAPLPLPAEMPAPGQHSLAAASLVRASRPRERSSQQSPGRAASKGERASAGPASRGRPFSSVWACGRGIAAGASERPAPPRACGKVTRGTPASASVRRRGQQLQGCGRTAPRGPARPHPALSPAAAPALPAARAASGTAPGAPTSACAAGALRTRPGPAHPRAAPPTPAPPRPVRAAEARRERARGPRRCRNRSRYRAGLPRDPGDLRRRSVPGRAGMRLQRALKQGLSLSEPV
ncbi:uncharacterized protein LOC129131659 isoform X2 [Agelaius phoeniceus]|uniref:uncharacterized protein LOC129131659 isoform X2 n=1 Tax=Agelaius phoeniceus TaxID=39638 RepID=UPI0040550F25